MLIVCNILMMLLLFLISISDIRERRIPNAMLGMWLALIVVCRMVNANSISVLAAIVGSLSIALFLLMLSWIRPGAFGFGDVKLMLVVGIHLGFGDVWYAFAIAIGTAAIFCLGGLILKKLTLKSAIPFGPFLCLGIGIMMVLG